MTWTARVLGKAADAALELPTSKDCNRRGGATAADVAAAATPFGLAAVTGNVGVVGMAGFLLAGGYGPLTTRFGLAVDNLLGAEIVLADGQLVRADVMQNEELFWALRGGGGNFGVVTSMCVRLHPVNRLLAGIILFPWAEAPPVLGSYAEMMSSAQDELSVLVGALPGPDGNPFMFLGPVWSGEPDRGEKVIARLQSLGRPVHTQIAPITPHDSSLPLGVRIRSRGAPQF